MRQLDVGEGTATLLSLNNKHALIDTGNPMGAFSLAAHLQGLTHGQLQYLILTHPHQDHIGGVFDVIAALSVSRIYDNGQKVPEMEEPYRWYQKVAREDHKDTYHILRAGQQLKLDDTTLTVLFPKKGELDSDWNKNSLVFRIDYGKFCALLMGDAIEASERELLQSGKIAQLNCPVVQVGHHGSRFASSQEFIDVVHAKTALVSINKNNIRGYPSPDTLQRWKNSGAQIYTTYNNGEILVTAQKDGSYATTTEK